LLPPSTPPTNDIDAFLAQLADRLRMLKRGGERDAHRAATWFINWWRDGALAGTAAPSTAPLIADSAQAPAPVVHTAAHPAEAHRRAEPRAGWGFDVEWAHAPEEWAGADLQATLQRKMEACIERHVWETLAEQQAGGAVSRNQEKKLVRQEKIAKRVARVKRIMGKTPTWLGPKRR
jgi:mitochondrial GTPase 1